MTVTELLEKLADAQHEIWSAWMKWQAECSYDTGTCWTIPREKRRRWERQMNTPYAELSEEEKESDRKVVREFLGFLLDGYARIATLERELEEALHARDQLEDICYGLKKGTIPTLERELAQRQEELSALHEDWQAQIERAEAAEAKLERALVYLASMSASPPCATSCKMSSAPRERWRSYLEQEADDEQTKKEEG